MQKYVCYWFLIGGYEITKTKKTMISNDMKFNDIKNIKLTNSSSNSARKIQ